MTFRTGVSDAQYLQHEFSPTFTEADILNVEKYNVYIKTIVNNEPVPAFSMDVTKDLKAEQALYNPKLAEAIKQLSRLKYGKDVRLVEAEINERAKL